jgi:hypothetical protein
MRLLVAFPKLSEEQREIQRDLIHDLAHIAQLKGEFQFAPSAYEFYERWYEDQSRFKPATDARVKSYYERKHVHVLKIAMALSMAESDKLVLEIRDIQMALEILSAAEPGMYKAFSAVGKNIYSTDLDAIRDQVQGTPGGATYKQVLAAHIHSVDRETIDKLLYSLIQMGEIELGPDKRRYIRPHG